MVHSSAPAPVTPRCERFSAKDWVQFKRGEHAGKTGQVLNAFNTCFNSSHGPQIVTVNLNNGDIVTCGSVILERSTIIADEPTYIVLSACHRYALLREFDAFESSPGELEIESKGYIYVAVPCDEADACIRMWKRGSAPTDPDGHTVTVNADGEGHCTCGDFQHRKRECKHLRCVRAVGLAKPAPTAATMAPQKAPIVYEHEQYSDIPF